MLKHWVLISYMWIYICHVIFRSFVLLLLFLLYLLLSLVVFKENDHLSMLKVCGILFFTIPPCILDFSSEMLFLPLFSPLRVLFVEVYCKLPLMFCLKACISFNIFRYYLRLFKSTFQGYFHSNCLNFCWLKARLSL